MLEPGRRVSHGAPTSAASGPEGGGKGVKMKHTSDDNREVLAADLALVDAVPPVQLVLPQGADDGGHGRRVGARVVHAGRLGRGAQEDFGGELRVSPLLIHSFRRTEENPRHVSFPPDASPSRRVCPLGGGGRQLTGVVGIALDASGVEGVARLLAVRRAVRGLVDPSEERITAILIGVVVVDD